MVQSSITMTVEEASRYSGIGRNTLRQLIDWGLIPVMRIGRKILIRVETLDLFVEKNILSYIFGQFGISISESHAWYLLVF